jgi:hypothetical protein
VSNRPARGGLTQVVPDFTTLVPFTTSSAGVFCGEAVLRNCLEGVLTGIGQGALLARSHASDILFW